MPGQYHVNIFACSETLENRNPHNVTGVGSRDGAEHAWERFPNFKVLAFRKVLLAFASQFMAHVDHVDPEVWAHRSREFC